MSSFETTTTAKWILTGEHAVLRRAPAIALPYPDKSLHLEFEATDQELEIFPPDANESIRKLLATLDPAPSPSALRGKLQIISNIPQGAGLGSSAALCVAVSRWLAPALKLSSDDIPGFATQLENQFHGQSSGMDVSVIASGKPIYFVRGQGIQTLDLKKLPRFTLHDTELRSKTSDCIAQVENIRNESPRLGAALDEAMAAASKKAHQGLLAYSDGKTEEGLKLLTQAMTQANQCFLSWRLIPHAVWKIQDQLREEGALATKLTGAGGGGFVVALWE